MGNIAETGNRDVVIRCEEMDDGREGWKLWDINPMRYQLFINKSVHHRLATRFRSRPSSSMSMSSGAICTTLMFELCGCRFRLRVRRLPRLEDVLAPPCAVPVPPGDETAEEGPPMEMAGELESSIIIIACRRLDPALMITGASANGMDDWECETGNGSEINVGGKWVVWAVGWNDSFVGVGRPLLALWRGAALSGGGEGDVGADGGVMLGTGELGVGSDEGCDN